MNSGGSRSMKASTKGASAVCETSDVYYRAIQYFHEALAERVAQHEDEVFTARARFQLQREQDREHFNRTQQKWLRAQGGHQGKAGDDAEGESIMGEFLADQRKLHLGHEDDLQQDYPLAFLDDETAGVVAFTLVPMLQSKLAALAQERTWQNREIQKEFDEEKCNFFADGESFSPKRGAIHALSAPGKSQNALVKEEYGQFVAASQDIGRGAYLIPQRPASQTGSVCENADNTCSHAGNGRADEIEEDGEEEVGGGGGVEEEEGGREHESRTRDDGGDVVSFPWLSNISTHGALEFVRVALLCNKKSRLAYYDEKRRCLERCMIPSKPQSALRLVQHALQRVSVDERRDAERQDELWRAWRAVKESLVSKDAGTVKGKTEGWATETTEGEHVDDVVNMSGTPLDKWRSPSCVLHHQRQMRLRRLGDNFGGGFGSASGAVDVFNHYAGCSFNTTKWMTLNLHDEDNSGDGSRMEMMAQTYLWRQHIENSIPHVLCGEARRSGKRWLVLPHNNTGSKTQANDGSSQRPMHDTQTEEAGIGLPSSSLVLALPQCATKVWLKVASQGDFVANEVRFYQSRPVR